MKVSILEDNELPEYHSFLRRCSGSMLYHSTKYRTLLERLLGSVTSRYYIAREEGEIVGALPSMWLHTDHGIVVNSLPFYGSHGGVLSVGNRSTLVPALLAALYQDLVNDDVLSCCFIDHLFQEFKVEESSIPFPIHFRDSRIGQLTPLPTDAVDLDTALFQLIDKKTRNILRKAASLNLNVEYDTSSSAFEELYQLHLENLNEIGGRAKPKQLFSLIPEIFEANQEYQLYRCTSEGQTIAMLLVFFSFDSTEYFTPVVKKEHRSLNGLSHLIFHAMKDSASRGIKHWNWGGTWRSQTGVYEFKRKWGALDWEYDYYIYAPKLPTYRELSGKDFSELFGYFYTVPYGEL